MKNSHRASGKSGMSRRGFFGLGVGAGAGAMLGGSAGALLTALAAPPAAAQETFVPGWDLLPIGARRPVSVDVHTHWTPEGYLKALVELGRPHVGAVDPWSVDLDKRRKWMDEHGVQTLALTLSGGMPWQWVSSQTAARLAQIVNDAAIEAHTAFPDRFIATVEIPARDAELSLKELNRVAGKPGMRSVHLPPTIEGREYILEPAFEPFLARCEELGYPLLFHPLDGEVNYYGEPQSRVSGKPLFDSVRYWNTLGFTFETATIAAKLIVTGKLDKHPRLEIVLPHSGGCFPYLAGRMEHSITRRKFPLQRPFKEYIRRFHYDSMTYDLETLRFLIQLVGSDRVLIGTDNSFGPRQNFEWPNAIVEHLKLPPADQERIFRGNAARLLKLT
jgi:aminocarboxymuconate-semialdehyde decarboxylase